MDGDKTLSAVFQFKVTLLGRLPSIWRRISVSSESTFFELHAAIQDAMGWKHQYTYEFYQYSIAKHETHRITRPQQNRPLSLVDYKIKDYYKSVGNSGYYVYDKESFWLHYIELESVQPRSPNESYPSCSGGERACPPEGLGGMENVDLYFGILANPLHPRHSYWLRYKESVGGPLTVDDFNYKSVKFVNAEMLYELGLPPPYKVTAKTHQYRLTF